MTNEQVVEIINNGEVPSIRNFVATVSEGDRTEVFEITEDSYRWAMWEAHKLAQKAGMSVYKIESISQVAQ